MASSYGMRGSTCGAWASKWKYDVFLSFRGEDTRNKFTDHLYEKLQWRGIKAFRDDPQLERGASISLDLPAAIEESRFAVVVISPNYASSTWCLLELAKIVQCMGKRGEILPIFYEVDPSDVRHQTESFAEAFGEHEDKFGKDSTQVIQWRNALTKVANLAGWTSKNYRYETELIKEIVEALWKKVHPTFASSESESFDYLVGIDSKLMEIDFLLEAKASDVCFIGIWGMGGIGKTTLARLVYQRISHHFEVDIFLTDVRQISATRGLVQLQEELLCRILKEKIQVWDVYDGRRRTKRCLLNKKVLLVLDDVDQLNQLENLAGGKDWFGSGSIIIITTRDRHLLVSHGIETLYKSKGLNKHEALQLFSWKAFKKDYPEEGFRELSESILDYAGGLPLALKILGSFMYKRDRGGWESAVDKLKKAPIDQKLFEALRISYDGLDEMSQQIFLDVVCFLKGNDKERVIKILDSIFGFDTHILIDVLIEKSLLTIFDNCVDMHDLIQEMGGEIVRLESKEEPGQRSRLWLCDDIFCVLTENTGTKAIRSITLCLPKLAKLAWNPNAFFKMFNLKFLKTQNLVLCQGPEYLPDAIRVLEWTSYPSKSLPPNFQPVELIELILHHSNIKKLWDGIKYLVKLTLIDLSYSENLIMTPDFTGIQNLERLVLEGCTNLVDIHPSITSLRRLKVLNFKNCRSIKSIPRALEMDSLEIINLSGCSKVNIFPQFVVRMEKLSELYLSGIGTQNSVRPHPLSRVLASLKHCFRWKGLHLNDPHPLSLVLASLKNFCALKGLNLNDCKLGEGAIPDDIGSLSSLEDLDLSVNNFVSLPATISRLSKLKCLNLADCRRLKQLPDLPLFSCGTCYVAADNCISLQKLPDPPATLCRLWKLSFNFINCCSITDGDIYDCSRYGFGTVQGTQGYIAPYSYIRLQRTSSYCGCNSDGDIAPYSYIRLQGTSSYCGCNSDGDGDSEDDGVSSGFEFEGVSSSSYIIYSMLQRFLQEPPPFFEMFSIVIPGNDIPGWFKNQSVGDSKRQKLPECSCNMWMGFGLCVLFGPEGNPGALGEDPHANTISCSWKPVRIVPAGFRFSLNKVVKSDHLCLFLLPRKYYLPEYGTSMARFIHFFFEADARLKVKKCGVRTLYNLDLKELNSRMNRYAAYRVSRDSRYLTVQENPPFSEAFSMVIPGIDIPVWFKNRREGHLVEEMLPCSSCSSRMLYGLYGFVVCVILRAEENLAALGEDHDLVPHAYEIYLDWKLSLSDFSGYSFNVEQVELSDHICVLFIPKDKLLHSERYINRPIIQFGVVIRGAACLKVQRCGVRPLYMQDVREPNTRMNQYGESMSRQDRIDDWAELLRSTICKVPEDLPHN